MPTKIVGLERLEASWQTLPWVINYLNTLPKRAEVNIKATSAEPYLLFPELLVFFEIQEHGSKTIAYYQLVLLSETGFQILKTYAGNNLVLPRVATKEIRLSLVVPHEIIVEFYSLANEVTLDHVER